MINNLRKSIIVIVALSITLVSVIGCGNSNAKKDSFPSKHVEFVVPFSPGGGSDILSRTVETVIREADLFPESIVIENMPGGSGSIGYSYLAEKKGDPHHIGTASASFWTAPILGQSPVSYKDFTPIAALCADVHFLTVNKDSPYRTAEELINAAKEKPGEIKFGGPVSTSDARIITALFEKATGVKVNYIPFQGGGEVVTNLLGGHIDAAFQMPAPILDHLKSGEIIALALAADERLEKYPDVPTFKELGFEGVSFYSTRGIVAPADLDPEAVKVWEETFQKMSEEPKWQDYLSKNELIPYFKNSKEFTEINESLNETYSAVLEELGIKKN